jgi:hypothetical protein
MFTSRLVRAIFWLGGLLLMGLLAIHHHGRWKAEERLSLIAQLEIEYEVPIFKYVQDASDHWVPYPWQARAREPKNLLNRIHESRSERLAALESQASEKHRYGTLLPKYFPLWSNQLGFCKSLESSERTKGAVEACASIVHARLEDEWLKALREENTNSFVDATADPPELRARISSTERVCNLTPLDVVVERVARLAESEVIDFYRQHLTEDVGTHQSTKGIKLVAGECRTDDIRGLGVAGYAGNIYYTFTYADPAKEKWFREIWFGHHMPTLGTGAALATMERQFIQKVNKQGAWLCDDLPEWFDAASTTCKKGKKRPFVTGEYLGEQSRFFGIQFLDSEPVTAPSGEVSLVDEATLGKVRDSARELARMVTKQYELHLKWNGKVSRIALTNNDQTSVSDENGPLKLGVSVSGIPSQTILKESLDIPSSGTVIAVHSERMEGGKKTYVSFPVYSIHDLTEAVGGHAIDRQAGIERLLFLTFSDGKGGEQLYVTRHRFNLSVGQDFDTKSPIWDGFRRELLFGIADWDSQQQFAYHLQNDTPGFGVGGFLGSVSTFLIGGAVVAKTIAHGMKSRLALAAVFGTTDAVLAASQTLALAPPMEPRHITIDAAKGHAKFAFAFGAIFAPIVRR